MKTTRLITICLLAIATAAFGQDDEGGERGGRRERGRRGPDEATRDFMRAQREARNAHFEAQGDENKDHREGLRETEPQAGCTSIITHRTTQHAENVTFVNGQHTDRIAFIRSHGAENEVPAEQIEERVEQMTERYEEAVERHQERHEELVETLTELSSREELTWREVHEAIRELMPEHGRRRGRDGDDEGRPRRRGGDGDEEDGRARRRRGRHAEEDA